MNYVILDLEWNGTYSRRIKGFINEIIEFGAVKVDQSLNIIDTFEALVRPQVGKKISGKIKTLTSITNEDLEGGLQFMQATSRFKKWMGDAVLMTWGTSDILTLIENYRYFCGSARIPFLTRYINLQAFCEKMLDYDSTKQMGLSTSAQLLEIDEDDFDHHRALGDSLLSLRCLQKLYSIEKLAPFIQDAETDEFYDRIQFKTVIICDLNNPLIKRSDMNFNCDICGGRAHRVSEWQLKNKSYRALFICRNCDHKFYGRVQFKLKYEGMTVKRAILSFHEEKDKEEDTVPQEES
ncbi:MAG TPA: 3'-5' exonuclease [Caproiciproducens sp.]|nr:3'-5' exonuclease [Caproiciproducens sp.]